MWAIATDGVAWSVGVSVCWPLSRALLKWLNRSSCRLETRPTQVGSKNHVLDEDQDRTNLFAAGRGDKSAMRPFIKILWPLVVIFVFVLFCFDVVGLLLLRHSKSVRQTRTSSYHISDISYSRCMHACSWSVTPMFVPKCTRWRRRIYTVSLRRLSARCGVNDLRRPVNCVVTCRRRRDVSRRRWVPYRVVEARRPFRAVLVRWLMPLHRRRPRTCCGLHTVVAVALPSPSGRLDATSASRPTLF